LFHSSISRIPFTDLANILVMLNDPTNRLDGSGMSNGPATGAHLDLVYPDLGAAVTTFSISITQDVRLPEPPAIVLLGCALLGLCFFLVQHSMVRPVAYTAFRTRSQPGDGSGRGANATAPSARAISDRNRTVSIRDYRTRHTSTSPAHSHQIRC